MTHASIAPASLASLIVSFGIALGLAAPAHAGDHTLHLAVHGSIDSGKLGAAIARELGVEVAVVEGTCDVPCLDIAIDGSNTATIVFVPRTGALRQRAVKLGSNTGQWQLVVTLLAGNVVRDESRDVLAGLPPPALPQAPAAAGPADVPPAPPELDEAPAAGPAVVAEPVPPEEPPAPIDVSPEEPGEPPVIVAPPVEILAPVAPEPVREHRFLGLGIVPGLSSDFTRVGSVRHFLSIHALVGVSGGSSGLSLSGLVGVERGLVSGVQLAGVSASAWRVSGTQVGGVAAVAGDIDGVQVAGTVAIAGRVDGIQAAGVVGYARGNVGTQAAGTVVATGGSAGTQVAGVSANARGDVGLQISGVSNVAGGKAGAQIAGLVNVASYVRGLQIAPINIAHQVDGVQIGVLNVGSAEGFSLGLINIVPGGRYDIEAAVDTDRIGTLLFRHGGRRWHNVYGIGGHSVTEAAGSDQSDDVWMYGFGFGPSLTFNNTVMDLELIGWQVNHGARHETDVSVLGQLRLSIAHHWGPFAVVAGGMLNAYATSDQQSPLIVERRTSGSRMDPGVHVTTWPSAFVGVRL